ARRIARRTVQIACGSRGRNSISPPAACRPEAVGASEAQAAPCRSPNLRLALSAVPFRARSRGCLQARDAGALDKDSPLHRPAQTVGRIAPVTWLGGLHRHYVRMA